MENKPDKLDKIERYLMSDIADVNEHLSPKEIEILQRYKVGYVYWLNRPSKSPTDIARYLQRMSKAANDKELSRAQAYQDVKHIQILLGNIKSATKDWKRYQLEQMALETYNMAKKEGDFMAMASAADKFGKYNQLDKEDVVQIPWEQMNIPQFDVSSDVTLVGVERHSDYKERSKKLKEKYGIKEVNESEIIYVEDEK